MPLEGKAVGSNELAAGKVERRKHTRRCLLEDDACSPCAVLLDHVRTGYPSRRYRWGYGVPQDEVARLPYEITLRSCSRTRDSRPELNPPGVSLV